MDSNHLGGLQPTNIPKSVYLELAARLLLKEKTAESRWFETTGQAPFGRAKAAYWKINLHDTAMGSRLHNLGIQQPWWRHEPWFGIAASIPLALRLVPHAVCVEQSPSILG